MNRFWKNHKWLPIYILGSLYSALSLLNQGLFLPALLIIVLVACLVLYLLMIDRHN